MGVWGACLFSNDIACDVRDTYINFLKQQFSNDEAYFKTYEEYSELMGTDEEAFFWYALAVTQWETGRLMAEVKSVALKFIENKSGLSLFEESEDNNLKFKKELHAIEEKIKLPMPPEKKFRKSDNFITNPWESGDIFAYEFHSDYAVKEGFSGKYILFQKIGNVEYYEDKIFSVVQIFDKIYDSVPDINNIADIRILPLVDPPGVNGTPDSIEKYIPSFEWFKKATMLYEKKADYPEKYFKYLGNKPVAEIEYISNDCTDFYIDRNGMDEWLIDFHKSWNDIDDSLRC